MNKKFLAITLGMFMVTMFMVPLTTAGIGMNERGKPNPNASCVITSPADGVEVSGTIDIAVTATDTPTIKVDGERLGKGFSLSWDTTTVADGTHVITAEIRGASDEITVTVNNGGGGGGGGTGDGVVRKWALVIGISDYEGDSSDLTYCDDDAYDWKNYLQSEGYSVNLLIDRQADWQGIIDALQALADAEDGDDMVAITYSGHGYYFRDYRQSCLVAWDLYGVLEDEIEAITDTFDSKSVFTFWDCCNIGTFSNLCNEGWVSGIGSSKTSYTYDGTPDMQNGIYTYYAMEAIDLGYYTAEDIVSYANQMFNAATPGRASMVDNYSGDLDL